jgi:SAM-dependent methyltransferase
MHMSSSDGDKAFTGSVPELYETYLVPLIFEDYAADMAGRLGSRTLSRVLEIAAGTGVVTRALASALPETVTIVASDLNQAMLDKASAVGTSRPVEWRQADALDLPWPDESFDAVVCQFGVMFFPDKAKAFSEVRRVLKPGGVFVFNVWDRMSENEFADIITEALGVMFPDDPPRFLDRTPYGYYDHDVIRQHLRSGGFDDAPQIETLAVRSRAASSDIPAIAYCQGTPLKGEIDSRDPEGMDQATRAASDAIAAKFGRGEVDGKIQAHVVTIEK